MQATLRIILMIYRITSNAKLFADDTSLFPTVTNPNATADQSSNYVHIINTWAYQWKMNFNPDTSRYFNGVLNTSTQNHIGMYLDFKLKFHEQFEHMLNKVNKTIGLLRKLQNTLPTPSLLTIYKSFIRPHLDYTALAITGDIGETSKEKLAEVLGLEPLKHRRW